MTITGTIKVIEDTLQISATFSKREFVIDVVDGDYTNPIKLEMTQDKCNHLDNKQVGQEVEVAFNLKGRKWTNPQGEDKYFNTLSAWNIKPVGAQPQAPQATPPPAASTPPPEFQQAVDSDLPF